MSKKQFPEIYAFIDSQNLNLGTRNDLFRGKKKIYSGWQLDFQKFRIYLSHKLRVSKAIIFIGKVKGNEELYRRLRSFGYDIVFKPTTKDSVGKPKGNIDAELVLHCAAIEFPNFSKAVIVSGDGDFYCLHKYLEENKKLLKIIIPNRFSESNLLRRFQNYKIILDKERERLKLKK